MKAIKSETGSKVKKFLGVFGHKSLEQIDNNTSTTRLNTRILLVDHELRTFLMHRIKLAKALQRVGFDVHVALPFESGLKYLQEEGFSVHDYYLKRQSTQPSDEFRCFSSLFKIYKQLKPSLIHHFGLKPALYGGSAARSAGVPAVVNTLTGLGHLFRANNTKAIILRKLVSIGLTFSFSHKNSKVIVQNWDDLNSLLMNGVEVSNKASLIKGSGVDISAFTPQPEPGGKPVIMMAARLIWEKGVGEFVKVAQILRTKGIEAEFVLAGEPDYNHPSAIPLLKLEEWKTKGYVKWIGWCYNMPQLMKNCHIFCLPSYYGEGVPSVLLEAAATGRPIITTDSVGCREVVRHGHNGLLVPVQNTKFLAEAIIQLIENPSLRILMGERSRALTAKEFSLNEVINKSKDIYTSLLNIPNY
ncbi:glycosyltransferase family 4 protein [soil metagenome]